MPPETPQTTPPVTPQPSPAVQSAPQPLPPITPALPVTPQPASLPQAPTLKQRLPKWLKMVLVVFVAIAILVVAIFIFVGSATKAPQKVSDAFVSDVQAGNTAAAYGLTSQRFKKSTSQDALSSVIDQDKPLIQGTPKVTGRAIQKTTGVPETAVFTYSVKDTDHTSYIKTELQKDGSDWRIINFNANDQPFDTKVE